MHHEFGLATCYMCTNLISCCMPDLSWLYPSPERLFSLAMVELPENGRLKSVVNLSCWMCQHCPRRTPCRPLKIHVWVAKLCLVCGDGWLDLAWCQFMPWACPQVEEDSLRAPLSWCAFFGRVPGKRRWTRGWTVSGGEGANGWWSQGGYELLANDPRAVNSVKPYSKGKAEGVFYWLLYRTIQSLLQDASIVIPFLHFKQLSMSMMLLASSTPCAIVWINQQWHQVLTRCVWKYSLWHHCSFNSMCHSVVCLLYNPCRNI